MESNDYDPGSYFALLFDEEGTKQSVMYGTDLQILKDTLHDIQEEHAVDYVILQVIENPRNRKLH